ncbi:MULTISPECIES: type II toxin-antitoxin system VapC family toxin [Cyanophyceae]|uniref:type II toxin-antitoxin system VapC family toxin n=1 Tax=Cyanophyceae TaxID=3028117 RepID=UPI00016DCB62|nr:MULTISPECIES: PIN domain-containing protein [Cyanophyceae]ACB00290.1 PIN domain protein [Picosynechococcus sp. PCC 7002]ANV91246.1 twitching motility protein PilT [Picosynechococcus sp. PCC 8807]QCS50773.1 PIN domain-containing protein [Picosynechococcus sp. PCC 11901]SMH52572.1 Predicted nucleic acid-binding protein, contains PIN domain [Picosynechococcus sp. OG1]SMQ82351.1 Predicted nucleic acid-binding protein, contains PIN domain [Synechococcus sp. 7002]
MERLVLDAGPLIALVSRQDRYHELAQSGFTQIPKAFGEIITPLPIVFEVYKFVSRRESIQAAQFLLTTLQTNTVIQTISPTDFQEIYELSIRSPQWRGSLEDASVLVVAKQMQAKVWTIDYRDLGFFEDIGFWHP